MSHELSAQQLEEGLADIELGSAVEYYPVALTTESLALAWLRQRSAPHGALVVAGREISARTRSGLPIPDRDLLSASIVLRPQLAIDYQDVIWAIPLIASLDCLEAFGDPASAWWPETVVNDEGPVGHIRVETQLAPGKIESTVITVRLSIASSSPEEVVERLRILLASVHRLSQFNPSTIAESYRSRCGLVGKPVRIHLRPNGSSGGRAASVDERGGFGVESSSGSIARFSVDQIGEIVLR